MNKPLYRAKFSTFLTDLQQQRNSIDPIFQHKINQMNLFLYNMTNNYQNVLDFNRFQHKMPVNLTFYGGN